MSLKGSSNTMPESTDTENSNHLQPFVARVVDTFAETDEPLSDEEISILQKIFDLTDAEWVYNAIIQHKGPLPDAPLSWIQVNQVLTKCSDHQRGLVFKTLGFRANHPEIRAIVGKKFLTEKTVLAVLKGFGIAPNYPQGITEDRIQSLVHKIIEEIPVLADGTPDPRVDMEKEISSIAQEVIFQFENWLTEYEIDEQDPPPPVDTIDLYDKYRERIKNK